MERYKINQDIHDQRNSQEHQYWITLFKKCHKTDHRNTGRNRHDYPVKIKRIGGMKEIIE